MTLPQYTRKDSYHKKRPAAYGPIIHGSRQYNNILFIRQYLTALGAIKYSDKMA
ncbi:hypothetical protein SAMN05443252_106212 [Bacillus sp. OV322]|nr:hypothetical protein SAMN05443252_106212 [Bacillus sp. OV322]